MLILLCLTQVSTLLGCKRTGSVELAPGVLAPEFELVDTENNKISLVSLKGKIVVLNFWAPWCAPCLQEMSGLNQLNSTLKEVGVVVLGVAVETDPEILRKFKAERHLSFQIASDSTGYVRDLYSVNGFPETFVIGRNGRLVLFPDLDGATVRIIGPREWGSHEVEETLRRLAGRSG